MLFGAVTPGTSRLAADTSPFVLAGLLSCGAALATAPVARRHPRRYPVPVRDRRYVTGAVISGGLVAPVLLMAGLARTPSATASILANLEVIATVALAAVVARRGPGFRVLAGMALVVAAGIVVAGGGDTRIGLGPVLVAGAAIAWGVDNTFTAAIDDIRPERIVAIKGAVAGPVNLLLGLSLDGPDGLGVTAVALVVILGATGYGLSLVWWIRSARILGAARTQVLFATAPVFGVMIAWWALGDPVLTAQVVALGLAALGSMVVTVHQVTRDEGEPSRRQST